MNNSFKTSNGISYLARQTTDMAPITIDTTIAPLALSNITRSEVVFVNNHTINIHLVLQRSLAGPREYNYIFNQKDNRLWN